MLGKPNSPGYVAFYGVLETIFSAAEALRDDMVGLVDDIRTKVRNPTRLNQFGPVRQFIQGILILPESRAELEVHDCDLVLSELKQLLCQGHVRPERLSLLCWNRPGSWHN